MHARLDRGAVRLLTRTGVDWTHKYPAIASALMSVPARQAYLDGELCGVRPDGTTSFSLIQTASDAGNAKSLVFFLFDLLHLDGEAIGTKPLEVRKERLRALFVAGAFAASIQRLPGRARPGFLRACLRPEAGGDYIEAGRCSVRARESHSAYRSQFVVVTYPWHPLHGQRVRVYGRQRRAGRQILSIEVQPGLSREIPAWMCDAAVCATISSGPPRIAVAALTELRAVLDLCSTGRQSDRSLTPVMTKGGSNETSLDQSSRSRSRSRRHDHVVGTGARRTAAGARRAAPPSSRQANQGDPDPTGNM